MPGEQPRTRSSRLGPIVAAAAVGILAAWVFRAPLEELLVTDAARRQADHVCRALKDGKLSPMSACSAPLSEAPELKAHYRALREQDGDWYSTHGFDLYPTVTCGNVVTVTALDRSFVCQEGRAVKP